MEYAGIYNSEIILSGSSSAYQIEQIIDIGQQINVQASTYSNTVAAISQVITVISLGIISIILSMVVRDIVAKRRRDFGVLKSAGYTTKQLAKQITIGFLPCAALGVLSGCVTGVYSVNPAISAIFYSSGVYNANVHIYPPLAALIGFFVLVFTLAVTYFSAMRIKRITVYELLTE